MTRARKSSFHTAFPNGFLWEITEVLAGPPNVTFKWRHWGTLNGPFKDRAPTGETIEVVGVSIARVNEDLKILSVEHFFDNSEFLKKLSAVPSILRIILDSMGT